MLILIALETVLGAIQGLADQMISAEQKAKLEEAKKERAANTWFKRLLKHMWKSKPLEDKSALPVLWYFDFWCCILSPLSCFGWANTI
jgi:hypothetical protein